MMLNRVTVFVVLLLALSNSRASAQYTVVDSNGTVVGSVIGQSAVSPWQTLVAMQDGDGLWLLLSVLRDDFSYAYDGGAPAAAFYTDANCGSTPYLRLWGGGSILTPPSVYRRVVGSGLRRETTGFYAGDPVTLLTFRSTSSIDHPEVCNAISPQPYFGGALKRLDLTQFVPPFTVQ
jgi:hypothetical protein